MDFELLSTDALENGVCVILDEETNASVTVRSTDSRKYTRAFQKKLLENRYQSRQGSMSEIQKNELLEKITNELFSETLIVGWENINIGKQPFPYSVENAMKVATDKAYLNVKKTFNDAAGADVAFRQSMIEDITKN